MTVVYHSPNLTTVHIISLTHWHEVSAGASLQCLL